MEEYQKGIYMKLSESFGEAFLATYPDLIADNLKPSSSTTPLTLHYNWSQVVESGIGSVTSMNSTWKGLFGIIRSCNFVIEEVDKYADENPEKAKNIKGQAFAVRALLYLTLTNVFSQTYAFTTNASHPGIPYITTSDISEPYNRQTVTEVYHNLITDLENAISSMPATVNDCRFMNGVAAKALLSRVYLYKGDYLNAKRMGMEVISQAPLMSIGAGYPTDMFKNKSAAQTEVLFQLTPSYNDYSVSQPIGVVFEIDYYRITNDLANVLREDLNDIRSSWIADVSGQWLIKKIPFGVAGGIGISPSADYYVPVLRSSEVFLTVAEACAKVNDEVNAKLYLNAVRKRADPTISDITATGQALLDLIYNERRKELCFEGFRMWDLQRLKQGVHREDVLSGYQTILPYPSDRSIAPIPLQDVKIMGLQQNYGY
jgi:hypothetical protein